VKQLADRGGYDIFVSCYCEIDDLVSQWRGYGAGGAGYSIGIPLSRSGRVLLIGVVYGDEAVLGAASKAIDLTIQRFVAARKIGPGGDEAAFDVITSLFLTLMLLAICSKKKVFSFEQAFRLIHLIKTGTSSEAVDFRTANGLVVPFVRLDLPRDNSERIALSSERCGPSLLDAATGLGVQMHLRARGLGHVPVLRSDVPLRMP